MTDLQFYQNTAGSYQIKKNRYKPPGMYLSFFISFSSSVIVLPLAAALSTEYAGVSQGY